MSNPLYGRWEKCCVSIEWGTPQEKMRKAKDELAEDRVRGY